MSDLASDYYADHPELKSRRRKMYIDTERIYLTCTDNTCMYHRYGNYCARERIYVSEGKCIDKKLKAKKEIQDDKKFVDNDINNMSSTLNDV